MPEISRTYPRVEGIGMDFKDMNISPELREKAKACKTPEEVLELAKKEGYKVSDAEMEAVSGGGWTQTHSCTRLSGHCFTD